MRFIYTVLLSAIFATTVHAQGEVIPPGDTRWNPAFQGNAIGAITTTNPRFGYNNVGEMSLELKTTGNMNDWAFFTRRPLAGESWGMLTEVSNLSFDWFRVGDNYWSAQFTKDSIPLYDWQYKSPVFRLLLENDAEIVWESYFNWGPNPADLSYINNWQTSNLLNGNFWYRQGNEYSVVTGECAISEVPVWSGLHAPGTINSIVDCFGDKRVTGVSVGVGSQWPHEYHGFVDNVVVGFNGNTVVNANFDRTSTVPEPSTYVMMVTGLAGLVLFRFRKTHA